MPGELIRLRHIFIDHSNLWGGARLASRLREPSIPDEAARVSVRTLDGILGGRRQGTNLKVVAGGIPPGMEALWAEYQKHNYDTQRLVRDRNWKELGVDHSLIGHMWKIAAKFKDAPVDLILVSGDGKSNPFGTSFYEVLQEVLSAGDYPHWSVTLASFHWEFPNPKNIRSPTSQRMLKCVQKSEKGEFLNLLDHYDRLVYHLAG